VAITDFWLWEDRDLHERREREPVVPTPAPTPPRHPEMPAPPQAPRLPMQPRPFTPRPAPQPTIAPAPQPVAPVQQPQAVQPTRPRWGAQFFDLLAQFTPKRVLQYPLGLIGMGAQMVTGERRPQDLLAEWTQRTRAQPPIGPVPIPAYGGLAAPTYPQVPARLTALAEMAQANVPAQGVLQAAEYGALTGHRAMKPVLGRTWAILTGKEPIGPIGLVSAYINPFEDIEDLPSHVQANIEKYNKVQEESPVLWQVASGFLADPILWFGVATAGTAGPAAKAVTAVRRSLYGIRIATAEPEELAAMVVTYGAIRGIAGLVGKASQVAKVRKWFQIARDDPRDRAFSEIGKNAEKLSKRFTRMGQPISAEDIRATSHAILYGEQLPAISAEAYQAIERGTADILQQATYQNLGAMAAIDQIDPNGSWWRRLLEKWYTPKAAPAAEAAAEAVRGLVAPPPPGAPPAGPPPAPSVVPPEVVEEVGQAIQRTFSLSPTLDDVAKYHTGQSAFRDALEAIWQRMKGLRVEERGAVGPPVSEEEVPPEEEPKVGAKLGLGWESRIRRALETGQDDQAVYVALAAIPEEWDSPQRIQAAIQLVVEARDEVSVGQRPERVATLEANATRVIQELQDLEGRVVGPKGTFVEPAAPPVEPPPPAEVPAPAAPTPEPPGRRAFFERLRAGNRYLSVRPRTLNSLIRTGEKTLRGLRQRHDAAYEMAIYDEGRAMQEVDALIEAEQAKLTEMKDAKLYQDMGRPEIAEAEAPVPAAVEPAAPVPEVEARKPWEELGITQEAFREAVTTPRSEYRVTYPQAVGGVPIGKIDVNRERLQERAVRAALDAGMEVAPGILADYPELRPEPLRPEPITGIMEEEVPSVRPGEPGAVPEPGVAPPLAGEGLGLEDTAALERARAEDVRRGREYRPVAELEPGEGPAHPPLPRYVEEAGVRPAPRVVPGYEGRGAPATGVNPTPQAQSHPEPAAPAPDYRITGDDQVGEATPKPRFWDNIEAVRLLKRLEEEGRKATPEEQAVLVKYTGWAGSDFTTPWGYRYEEGVWAADDAKRKHWGDEYRALREVLTEEEYIGAARARMNAFYTSPEVIQGMWDGLERLGLKNLSRVQMLEPSAGAGHFLGLMPQDVAARADRTAVELDPLTGRFLKQLYQSADVRIQGFEDTRLGPNSFDLVISNVPFGTFSFTGAGENLIVQNWLSDRSKAWLRREKIHNQFFALSMELVRPGGVVAFITSKGTMDATGTEKLRAHLADQADLLMAVRLPKTAFKKNAGTEVVTDIIFLRKRKPGEAASGEAWLKSPKRKFRRGYYEPAEVARNEYYDNHPENILGKEAMTGAMYRGGEYTVEPLADRVLAEQLAEAVARLPENALNPAAGAVEEAAPSTVPAPIDLSVKPGAYVLSEDGVTILERVGREFVVAEIRSPNTNKPRIRGQLRILKVLDDVYAAQREGWPETDYQEALAKLNEEYDKYTAKHGALHRDVNWRAMAAVQRAPLLALEKWDEAMADAMREPVTKEGAQKTRPKKKLKASDQALIKADVFYRRTIRTPKRAESAETARDGLLICLDELGRPDLARIAELLGNTEAQARQALGELVYDDPNGPLLTADEYLSGDVVTKLAAARQAAESDPKFRVNVTALEGVQPEPLKASEISVGLGAPWLPNVVMEDFLCHVTGLPTTGERRPRAQYVPSTGQWVIPLGRKRSRQGDHILESETWGTALRPSYRLVDAIANSRDVKVTYKDVQGHTQTDAEETAAAKAKAQALREEFTRWVWEDATRAEELVDIYNRTFNRWVVRAFDGSHLSLAGLNPEIELMLHQRAAVWRILATGNTLLAHEVGSGKTFEMIVAGMEARRLGLARKNLYVVPNQVLSQWVTEFGRLYPAARILAPDKSEFAADKRAQMLARIQTGDWDAVILPQSQFTKLQPSPDLYGEVRGQLIQQMRDAAQELRQEGMDETTANALEKAVATAEGKLQVKIAELRERQDVHIYWDELGIDQLFVDESDMYKNLKFATKKTRIKGLSNTDSQRAFDMLVKVRHLGKQHAGRGLVFATGTPIANTIAELWTTMRYLMPDILDREGLRHFDSWAATYAEEGDDLEYTVQGAYRQVTRFSRFTNMPELSRVWQLVTDIVLGEDVPYLEAKKPKLLTGARIPITSPRTEWHDRWMEYIVARIDQRIGKVPLTQDNYLKLYTHARLAALDPRMVADVVSRDPLAANVPAPEFELHGKLAKASQNIARIYRETMEEKGTQLVFADMGTPKSAEAIARAMQDAFDLDEETTEALLDLETKEEGKYFTTAYGELKRLLVHEGIPVKEIAFIHDAKTDLERGALFEGVNSGRVRVLIGSTQKLGVGVNVQERVRALHHIDTPWRPRDIEQREGRILRMGNEVYGPVFDAEGKVTDTGLGVEIYQYLCEGSFDGVIWQTVEAKWRAIKSMMKRNVLERTIEGTDSDILDSAKMRSLATGNPLAYEEAVRSNQLVKVVAAYGRWFDQRLRGQKGLRDGADDQAWREQTLAQLRQDLTQAEATGFSLTLGEERVTEQKRAGQALQDYIQAHKKAWGRKWQIKNAVLPSHKQRPYYYETIGEFKGFEMEIAYSPPLQQAHLTLYSTNPLRPGVVPHYGTQSFDVQDDASSKGWLRRLNNRVKGIAKEIGVVERRIERGGKAREQWVELLAQPFAKAGDLARLRVEVRLIQAALEAGATEMPDLTEALEAEQAAIAQAKAEILEAEAVPEAVAPPVEVLPEEAPPEVVPEAAPERTPMEAAADKLEEAAQILRGEVPAAEPVPPEVEEEVPVVPPSEEAVAITEGVAPEAEAPLGPPSEPPVVAELLEPVEPMEPVGPVAPEIAPAVVPAVGEEPVLPGIAPLPEEALPEVPEQYEEAAFEPLEGSPGDLLLERARDRAQAAEYEPVQWSNSADRSLEFRAWEEMQEQAELDNLPVVDGWTLYQLTPDGPKLGIRNRGTRLNPRIQVRYEAATTVVAPAPEVVPEVAPEPAPEWPEPEETGPPVGFEPSTKELKAVLRKRNLPAVEEIVLGKLGEQQAWSDGFLAEIGADLPEQYADVRVRSTEMNLGQIVPGEPGTRLTPVGVTKAAERKGTRLERILPPKDYVVFQTSDGTPILMLDRYYAHFARNYPDAAFYEHGPRAAIEVRSGGQPVGLVIPGALHEAAVEPLAQFLQERYGVPVTAIEAPEVVPEAPAPELPRPSMAAIQPPPPPPEGTFIEPPPPEEPEEELVPVAAPPGVPPPPEEPPPPPPEELPEEWPEEEGVPEYTSEWDLLRKSRDEVAKKPPLKDRIRRALSKATLELLDRYDPLKAVERKTGMDVYQEISLVGGAAIRAESLLKQHAVPVLRPIADHVEEWKDYMEAWRMLDLQQINPEAALPGGVTSPEAALEEMQATLAPELWDKIETAARAFWAINDQLKLQEGVRGGHISAADAALCRLRYPHYFPFYRQGFDDLLDWASVSRGDEPLPPRVFSERILKEGSLRQLKDPLEAWFSSVIREQVWVARNLAKQSLVPALRKFDKKLVERGDHEREGWGVVKYRVDGKIETVTIAEPYARIANSLDAYQTGLIRGVLRKIARPLRVGAVVYNPDFPLVNLFRDVAMAWWTEGLVPFSKTWAQGIIKTIRHEDVWHDAAQAQAFTGGIMRTSLTGARVEALRPIGAAIEIKSVKDIALMLPRAIAWLNEVMEQGTRLATWMKLADEGLMGREQAFRCANSTINFDQAGFAMRVLNEGAAPFINPRTQAAYKLFDMARRNPRTALARAALFTVPAIVFWLWNKRFKSSKDIPDYEWRNNYILMLGEGQEKPDPRYPSSVAERYPVYLKLPKAEIVTAVTAGLEAMLNTAWEQEDRSVVEVLLGASLEGLLEQSPLDPSLSILTPPVIGTAVQIALNRDMFTKRDLVPQGEEGRPPEDQYGPETSKVAIALGKQFKVSPRYIDFAIVDNTAGAGRAALWGCDLALEALGYKPIVPGEARVRELTALEQMRQMPVVRRLLGTRGTAPVRRAYRNLEEATKEARRKLYRIPEVKRFGLGIQEPGRTITVNGTPMEVEPEQRSEIMELSTERLDTAWRELISRDFYADMSDAARYRMLNTVRTKIRGNVRDFVLQDLRGEPAELWAVEEMPDLITAYGLYEEYQAIPQYIGLTPEETAAVSRARGTLTAWGRVVPDMPTATLRALYAQQDPMGAYLLQGISRRTNPLRRRFWAAYPLLSRYFGGVPEEEMQMLLGLGAMGPGLAGPAFGPARWAEEALARARQRTPLLQAVGYGGLQSPLQAGSPVAMWLESML